MNFGIIDAADVGRTTFYAHFATKDALLEELCTELFGHVFSTAMNSSPTKGLYSDADAAPSVFGHLLQHLERNEHNILALLSGESSGLFQRYFRKNLDKLVRDRLTCEELECSPDVPKDFLVSHIAGSFVELVRFWLQNRERYSIEQLDAYFRTVLEPVL